MNKSRWLIGSLILLLLVAVTATGQSRKPQVKPSELVCRMQVGYGIELINAEYGTTTRSQQAQTNCYLLVAPQGADAESLAVHINGDPRVQYCGANYVLSAPEGFQRSSPFVDMQVIGRIDSQQVVRSLLLPDAHLISLGTDVKIAIIDGGIDPTHPYFSTSVGSVVMQTDYVDGDALPIDEPLGTMSGHGTFVTGVIRLVAPEANLNIYRVLDTAGLGDGYSIASAVLEAVEDSCRIINLSLGMAGIHDGLDDALRYANQHGVLILAAAGNDSSDLGIVFPFPASRTYCMAVAALDSTDRKASFSNFGVKVAISAPGIDIYAPFPGDLYAWWSGTSFSTPLVAGLAALMMAANPNVPSEVIDSLICRTALNIDSINPLYVGELGAGRIDPVAALETIAQAPSVGDINGDLMVDLSDVMLMVDFLFFSSDIGTGIVEADGDCSGSVDLGDLSVLIDYVFFSQPISCEP